MPTRSRLLSQLSSFLWDDPLFGLAVAAAVVALATTPVALAVLGRMGWMRTRRGRTIQKPAFWSVVCSMILVMVIPAIFLLLALKSRAYDRDRYEFDPNRTLSVLDQGARYASLEEADKAVRDEQVRLGQERKKLVDGLRDLDTAMLELRKAALRHQATYQALPTVLDKLAVIHKAVGLDAPQQLLDETAPPVEVASAVGSVPNVPVASTPAAVAPSPAAPVVATPGGGISETERQNEMSAVPGPQKALAALLPLTDVPAGWVVPKSGDRHLETFNADNLYEKIDGHAESFLQYGVVGMAYTSFHPRGDDSIEAQLYIYDMGNPLKAFGKYGSEKPDESKPLALGDGGYTSAGSAFFYAGPYYVQVITTSEDPKLAAFAETVARKVVGRMQPKSAPAPAVAAAPAVGNPELPSKPFASAESSAAVAASPEQLFKLLPAGPDRSGEKYVARDVFGYSFLTDVFMADFKQSKSSYWQGFVRPYESPEEAKGVLEQYASEVKEFGAQVQEVKAEGADRMLLSTLDGLTDAVFLKGNALAGVNGSTDAKAAESFAREFAKSLPKAVPTLGGSRKRTSATEDTGKGTKTENETGP